MREEFKIHRDLKQEQSLKVLIKQLEDLLESDKMKEFEDKLIEANKLVSTEGREVCEYTIQCYYSWTSLDGLVGELTMHVPKVNDITKNDFTELIEWMRKIINEEEELKDVDYEYFDNFYREFFDLNFKHSAELYEAVFEAISIEEVVKMWLSDKEGNDDIIYL